MALGQNDNYPVDYMKVEAEKKAQGVCVYEQESDQVTQVENGYSYCCEMADKWRNHYKDFLKSSVVFIRRRGSSAVRRFYSMIRAGMMLLTGL